ncbi:MAG: tetratricopeptide repeat protein [Spirochaetaceae bacterium]
MFASLVPLVALMLLAGCDSEESPLLDGLVESEGGREEVSEERIEELKRQIAANREIVEEKVEAAGELGVYYRMLGRAYMNRELYGPALDAFEEALEIETANPRAFYQAAVAAGYLGNAAGTEEEAVPYFEKAERYYGRAVELDPEYADALYGLAVLYVFEMDRPEEALSLLDRAMDAGISRARALMVKGRALLELGRRQEAAEVYGQAAERTTDDALRRRAEENRRQILGESQ